MADAVQTAPDAAHDAHHGHDDPTVAHHYESAAQQFDASKLGMWLFLATEVLFFAGLFCAYAVYRATHPEIFEAGHQYLSVFWGGLNTVVLILSSLTMAMAVYYAQRSMTRPLIICLSLTLLGAFGFMGVKAIEYTEKIQHGLVWGIGYVEAASEEELAKAYALTQGEPPEAVAPAHAETAGEPGHEASPKAPLSRQLSASAMNLPEKTADGTAVNTWQVNNAAAAPAVPGSGIVDDEGHAGHDGHSDADGGHGGNHTPTLATRNVHIFMGIYFAMTGLHGIHVLGGIVVIAWLLRRAIRGEFHGGYYTPVDLVGLYWHVVDLVWIFLFPLLYLIH